MSDDGLLLKNTAFNVLAKGSASAASLVISMYASRKIGVEGFGTAQYIVWLVSTLWMFLNFGLPITLVRYIAMRTADGKKENAAGMIRWSLAFALIISAVSIFVFVFALNVPSAIWIETLLLFSFLSFNSVLQSVYEGLMRYRELFYASAVSVLCMLLAFYPLIRSFSLQGYIAVLVIGAAANFLALLAGLGKESFLPGRTLPRALFGKDVQRFALFSWLAAIISSFMWQRMELFFIKTYLTAADVAFFSVAVLLSAYVTQPIALLSSALLPYFSRESAGPDNRSSQAIYWFLTKVFAWLTFFACFFTSVHSPMIVRLIYGGAYEPAQNVTAIILAGSSFGTIAAVGSALLYAKGRSRFIVISGGVGAAMAILVGIFIVPRFGILGAGIGRVVIQFFMICIGTYYIVVKLRFPFPFRSYFKTFGLTAGICVGLHLLLPDSSIVLFAINGILALLVYVACTYFFSIFDEEELAGLKSVLLAPLLRAIR